ncbi:hypothetical protein BXY64_1176 [Marinifilum flexuosum]|uniref:LPP20 lipoprotein n=1 Tax=Marinifilum flexuosum TaxID=1117708 RepID=A0A419X8T6_9BACT|nr:hypothetical protein BXY64_1176 [Marinifilum flexuosum]
MARKFIVTLFFLNLGFSALFAQSVEQIKADRNNYIWGEGDGITLKNADQQALSMLISQISTHVESEFSLLHKELQTNGKGDDFKTVCKSVVNSYSSATLKNTERIILKDEPEAKIFRYIKKADVQKIFQERKDKINGFIQNAENALEKTQVADALRYYYWALTLLKSHPNGGEMKYLDKNQKSYPLATWIPLQINNIFVDLDIQISNIDKQDDECIYTLDIKYKNKPAENFDYCYWDGMDYSNLISARNGIGLIELYGMASTAKKLKVKAEYIFEGEARIDRELEDVLAKIDPIPFRNSYYTISLENPMVRKTVSSNVSITSAYTVVDNPKPYEQIIESVLNSIRGKRYATAQNEFTPEGFDVFNRIIRYGNAKLIGDYQLKFIKDHDKVICRSVPMCFNFKTNNKQFVEEIIFHFNKDKKIEALSFGLSKAALDNILLKKVWKERDRMILINFLEHYKTAYALKRLDYIENIFSDDALIITGTLVKAKPNEMNQFKNNRIIKYNRQTKYQYLRNLKSSFASKEYINIKFEDSNIRKAGKGGDIFGVQIKQNYFSSNYGDVGYLFLIVDLNNSDEPIIHVRTWQPKITSNDNLYDLSNFN